MKGNVMKKTKYQKTCLKLAIFFCLIAVAASYAMVDLIYDSYSHDVKMDDGLPMKLFGPKPPYDLNHDWEYRHRFEYNHSKEIINC